MFLSKMEIHTKIYLTDYKFYLFQADRYFH